MKARDGRLARRTLAVTLLAAAMAAPLVLASPGQAPRATTRDLLDPASFRERAPALYKAVFDTTVGTFVVQVHREWAPNGADRFYNLVKRGYYDDCRFFRVVKDFVGQWGIHGDPDVNAVWSQATIPIDRARKSNIRGRVTFAMAGGAETRTTQVFINFRDNSRLDIDGFGAIGEVVTSMVLVERMFHEYGEAPNQNLIQLAGNRYLAETFPRLDYIKKATVQQ